MVPLSNKRTFQRKCRPFKNLLVFSSRFGLLSALTASTTTLTAFTTALTSKHYINFYYII